MHKIINFRSWCAQNFSSKWSFIYFCALIIGSRKKKIGIWFSDRHVYSKPIFHDYNCPIPAFKLFPNCPQNGQFFTKSIVQSSQNFVVLQPLCWKWHVLRVTSSKIVLISMYYAAVDPWNSNWSFSESFSIYKGTDNTQMKYGMKYDRKIKKTLMSSRNCNLQHDTLW